MIADLNRSRAVQARLETLKAQLPSGDQPLVERLQQGFTHCGTLSNSSLSLAHLPAATAFRDMYLGIIDAVALEHIYGGIDFFYTRPSWGILKSQPISTLQLNTRQEADEVIADIVEDAAHRFGGTTGPSPRLVWRDLYDYVHDLARAEPRH